MNIVAICVCVISAIIAFRKERNIYNPSFLMAALWGVITFLSNLRLFELYEASELTYLLISIGILCFCFAGSMSKRYSIKIKNAPMLFIDSAESTINYTALKAFCLLSVLLLLYPAVISLTTLISGNNFTYIRSENDRIYYTNIVIRMVYNYIVRPFSFSILAISAVNLFLEEKKEWFVLFSTLFIVVERVLIEGGRFVIGYIIISFILGFLMSNYSKKERSKKAFFLILFIGIAVYVIVQISISRGISEWGYSLYVYLCGCVPNLSIRLNGLPSGDYAYGLSSLSGVFNVVFGLLENVGLSTPAFYTHIKELIYVENGVRISGYGGSSFNAFVGPFFYYYVDLGITGVAIGMLFYGFVSYHFYKSYMNNRNARDLALYILVVQGIATSMVRLQFVNHYYTLSFLFVYLLINQRKGSLPDSLE